MKYFSHVVIYGFIRVFMVTVNQYNLNLEQIDIKNSPTHRDLEETIYTEQPNDFYKTRLRMFVEEIFV